MQWIPWREPSDHSSARWSNAFRSPPWTTNSTAALANELGRTAWMHVPFVTVSSMPCRQAVRESVERAVRWEPVHRELRMPRIGARLREEAARSACDGRMSLAPMQLGHASGQRGERRGDRVEFDLADLEWAVTIVQQVVGAKQAEVQRLSISDDARVART